MRREKTPLIRILAALLAAVLLTACGSQPEKTTEPEETEDPNVGRYYIGAVERDGKQVPVDEDAVESIYLRLKDDGDAVLQLPELKYDGSWKVKKEVLTLKLDSDDFKKEEYEGSIEDGAIDIVIDDIHLTFVKGKNAAKEYVKAHPVTEAESTEAPTAKATEASTEAPTEAPGEPTVLYVLQWNAWHPERDEIEDNRLELPADGSEADLYVNGHHASVPWSSNGNSIYLTIEDRDFIASYLDTGRTRMSITSGELQAYFVLGYEKALEVWDFAYGSDPETTEAPETTAAPAESTASGNEPGDGFVISEQVICDRDGIKVTALRTVYDEYQGRGIEFKVENSTAKDIYVASELTEANGAMLDDDFYCRAEPGKTETEILYFNENLLKGCSIEKIGHISFYLRAVDRGTYDTIFDVEEKVIIKTGDYADEDKPQLPKNAVLMYEKDGIKAYFVSTGMDKYDYMYSLLYFENTSGSPVAISEDTVQLNGIDIDGYIYNDEVEDGCILFCDLEYEKDSLKEAGITSLDDLTSAGFSFEFYDLETYADIAVTDLLKIEFAQN